MAEEKILQRVKKLLDKANDPSVTPEERQAFIEGADKLMIKHEIDEAMLDATLSQSERRKPVKDYFQAADANAEYWEQFRTVMGMICKLHGVRIVYHYEGDVTLFGFRDDVEYVKMKWLNIYLHFTKMIDPVWDLSLTIDHNVYNFKTAGHPWQDIQHVMFGVTGIDKPLHFFKPSYRRHCKVIGEEPRAHTQRNFAYRNSFTVAFVNRLCARIEIMIEARNEAVAERGALVHVSKAQLDVDEMLYGAYPHLRPQTDAERQAKLDELRRLHQQWLESLSPEERRAYEVEQQRLSRQAAKDNARYWRQQSNAFDAEGANLGRSAADKVDLNRNAATDTGKRGEL
jgi:hypothetical protein